MFPVNMVPRPIMVMGVSMVMWGTHLSDNGSAVVPYSIAAIPSLCNYRFGFVCCHSNAAVRILLFSECPCSPSKRREVRLLMNCRLSADD